MAVEIINSGLDYLIFALDGATAKTYQKIRVGGDFEKVEQNIKSFLQLKKGKRRGPFTVIQFIVMKENEKEADLFLEKWRNSGADAIRIKPVVDFFNRKNRPSLIKKCIYPYRMINIYHDGSVVPCCEDNFGQYCLGNIKNKSLVEIWNDLPARSLRRRLSKGDRKSIPLCRHCHYPQPSSLGVFGLTLFDNLKVKKILPWLERWPIFKKMIFYD